MEAWRQHVETGHRIIELWPSDGATCGCGNPGCRAAGKHPRYSHWPTTPHLDDETVDEVGDLYAHGYGVLVDGLLVVDVDARAGGVESLAKLEKALSPGLEHPFSIRAFCDYAVATGSGGGSAHYYFKAPPGVSLVTKLNEYPGIDFKSSGFVVGCESMHHTGQKYERLWGEPKKTSDAPASIVEILRKKEVIRAQITDGGRLCDIAMSDIRDAVSALSIGMGYDEWVRVGMALHHALQGHESGLELWDAWSRTAPEKYTRYSDLKFRWDGFGKSSNPVKIGTLFMLAKKSGWTMPAHMLPARPDLDSLPVGSPPIDIRGVDLLRPPGFAGEVASWIDSQCLFPRPRLVAAAALLTVGNTVGLSWEDDISGATANILVFCIAGSASGKEAVGQAVAALHVAAGLSPAVHGAIKSTQEITRNLIAHQSAYYMIDELGILLGQIVSAQKRGGAAYLEGVIGDIMKIYSKADGIYLVSGDVKREARGEVERDIKSMERQLDVSGQNPRLEERIARTRAALESLDVGINKPFLSMIGYSTESTFSGIMSYDQATSGFLGRALLVRETDDNPMPRDKPRSSRDVPEALATTLELLAHGQVGDRPQRIEMQRPRRQIITTDDAREVLDAVRLWTYTELAAHHQERTGLTPIARRCYEQIAKISLILAAPSGVRTIEHVRWATAFAVRDVNEKVREVIASERDGAHALHAAVMSVIGDEHQSLSSIRNARTLRKESAAAVQTALDELVASGHIIVGERPDRRSKGRVVQTYARSSD